MKRIFFSVLFFLLIMTSCQTIDLEENNKNKFEEEIEKDEDYSFMANMNHSDDDTEINDEEVYTEEIIQENDFSSAVIYIEPPEIISGTTPEEKIKLKGTDALKQNLKDITVLPEYTDGRLKGWRYTEGNIYQIHTQTYHSTIIQLEPGEEMLEVPYISEPDVWRMSRGVGIKEGKDTQFLIIKPDYSGLASTLIIITNKRVYQMEILSYKDHYMPYVQWVYPRAITDSQSWLNWQDKKTKAATVEFSGTNIEYCSFDYKIRFVANRKPDWCPTMVYDDGKFTYIVLDEKTLFTEMPTAFIGSKKLVNTSVHKNVIVINQLIKKVTLRLGKNKVTIIKKKSK